MPDTRPFHLLIRQPWPLQRSIYPGFNVTSSVIISPSLSTAYIKPEFATSYD